MLLCKRGPTTLARVVNPSRGGLASDGVSGPLGGGAALKQGPAGAWPGEGGQLGELPGWLQPALSPSWEGCPWLLHILRMPKGCCSLASGRGRKAPPPSCLALPPKAESRCSRPLGSWLPGRLSEDSRWRHGQGEACELPWHLARRQKGKGKEEIPPRVPNAALPVWPCFHVGDWGNQPFLLVTSLNPSTHPVAAAAARTPSLKSADFASKG